jgi:AraC-like DNA-binding protein
MFYREYDPHPMLRQAVKCYWVLGHAQSETVDDIETVLMPDGCIEVVFCINNRFRDRRVVKPSPVALPAQNQQALFFPESLVIGHQKQALSLYANDRMVVVAIRFYAWGAAQALGLALHEINHQAVALRDVLGEEAHQIYEQLYETPLTNIAAVLDTFLIKKIQQHKEESGVVRVAAALMKAQQGKIKVPEIASICALSKRQLERTFIGSVGLTPKEYARFLRFEAARLELKHSPSTHLTQLALDYGYFDQAHFSNDFKSLCGKTPSEYILRCKKALR